MTLVTFLLVLGRQGKILEGVISPPGKTRIKTWEEINRGNTSLMHSDQFTLVSACHAYGLHTQSEIFSGIPLSCDYLLLGLKCDLETLCLVSAK